ncbi:hypothetical protein ACFL6W_05395 [Thermodesulfobacteriota bacterium]
MKNKILYIVLVVVIVIGAMYSYKRLDFGGKTTIFFKIAFGDQETMMRMPPKKSPPPDTGTLKPPEGRQEDPVTRGGRDGHGPPRGKRGKPGMGKVIYLGNVIPYTFILAFFILITRVFDMAIRKTINRSQRSEGRE